METHGKITEQDIIAIIPARYSSERLPGKLLLEAGGRPIIAHTLDAVRKSRKVSRVIVAVDNADLYSAVKQAGGEVVMTSARHTSGSDRIAEVAAGLEGDPIIVNVQGDEPMITRDVIDSAIEAMLSDPSADMVTTCEPLGDPSDVLNPDVVKVVADSEGRALYFSRSPVPYPREAARKSGGLKAALEADPGLVSGFRKHTGLYVFRKESLLHFTSLEPTPAEVSEKLEQLRALENGFRIKVVEVAERSVGIDTEDDLRRFRELLSSLEAESANV